MDAGLVKEPVVILESVAIMDLDILENCMNVEILGVPSNLDSMAAAFGLLIEVAKNLNTFLTDDEPEIVVKEDLFPYWMCLVANGKLCSVMTRRDMYIADMKRKAYVIY